MTVLVYALRVRVVRARQGGAISICVCMCCQIHASHGKEPRYAHASMFPWPRPCSEARCTCPLLMGANCCCGFRRELRTARLSDYEGRVCLFWESQTSVVISTLK